jgi:hypothetical protein
MQTARRPERRASKTMENPMASTTSDVTTGQKSNATTGQNQGQAIGSPISNEAYDVITALQAKLEGLEAYRKYAKNGNAELWQSLTTTDIEGVGRLLDQLEQVVQGGRLRMTGTVQSRS